MTGSPVPDIEPFQLTCPIDSKVLYMCRVCMCVCVCDEMQFKLFIHKRNVRQLSLYSTSLLASFDL